MGAKARWKWKGLFLCSSHVFKRVRRHQRAMGRWRTQRTYNSIVDCSLYRTKFVERERGGRDLIKGWRKGSRTFWLVAQSTYLNANSIEPRWILQCDLWETEARGQVASLIHERFLAKFKAMFTLDSRTTLVFVLSTDRLVFILYSVASRIRNGERFKKILPILTRIEMFCVCHCS